MKKRMIFILSLLVMLAMACNLATNTTATPQAPGNAPQGGGNQPGGNQPSGNQPGGNLQPAGTPDPRPVNVNEGLRSLNSYQMVITINTSGPDPSQSSKMTIESQHSQDQDAYYTKMSNTSIEKAGAQPNSSTSEIYQIGNDQCTVSGEDSSWSSMPPNQAEMVGLITGMLGMTPIIDNPNFVAQETVNGIPSNHFSFKVSGLGVKSGAKVNANQGDYWLAVDGQYIVKYILILETSTDPQTDVLHEEVSIELTQANQPVNIAFPQSCLDASKVTPTP
jgi:hypothetical protein